MHSEQFLYAANMVLHGVSRWLEKPNPTVNTILVVKLDEIGDMIYALPVFEALKLKYPNAQLNLYCKKPAAQLLHNNPFIDKIYFELPDLKPDIWVELRGNWSTLFKSLLTRPSICLDRGTIRILNKFKGGQKQEKETNLSVIKRLFGDKISFNDLLKIKPKLYPNELNRSTAEVFLKDLNVNDFYIIHTGANDLARRWPIERYAELANQIYAQKELIPILAGGPDEVMLLKENLHLFPSGTQIFAGKGNLLDFTALCEKAKFFVGNESGPLHIAASVGIKCIGLYGPGVKDVFYPPKENSIVIHKFKKRNHTKQNPQNSSIYDISVEEVMTALNELIS